jgi:hypothetical protein
MDYAYGFFMAIDRELEQHAKAIQDRVFALYRDMPWTAEQYRKLQPVVRDELDQVVRSVLKICDNVGSGKVPDNVLGYQIIALPKVASDEDVLEAGEAIDICQDERDYAEMWTEFLERKPSATSTQTLEGESGI